MRHRLADDTSGLDALAAMIGSVDIACTLYEAYRGMTALTILSLIIRIFVGFGFQDKAGLATRGLAAASPDMLHFVAIATAVFTVLGFLVVVVFPSVRPAESPIDVATVEDGLTYVLLTNMLSGVIATFGVEMCVLCRIRFSDTVTFPRASRTRCSCCSRLSATLLLC